MGHKNSKGAVSITNYRGRIRLRWRYQDKRYSLSLATYNKVNLSKATLVAAHIEKDMAYDVFDDTLERYKPDERKPISNDSEVQIYFSIYLTL
ncbi:MAG: Arm DNA-binding domain-containing protein [Sediminibacterium sp.]|jgi:integrase